MVTELLTEMACNKRIFRTNMVNNNKYFKQALKPIAMITTAKDIHSNKILKLIRSLATTTTSEKPMKITEILLEDTKMIKFKTTTINSMTMLNMEDMIQTILIANVD